VTRVYALTALAFGAIAACQVFGPADQAALTDDAALIAHCESIGRECKADGGTDCYHQYDLCMYDAGLR